MGASVATDTLYQKMKDEKSMSLNTCSDAVNRMPGVYTKELRNSKRNNEICKC